MKLLCINKDRYSPLPTDLVEAQPGQQYHFDSLSSMERMLMEASFQRKQEPAAYGQQGIGLRQFNIIHFHSAHPILPEKI